ncbi:response regulator [Phenylobacterium sp. J426]|uniref:response regulator n=1 Tax=Phenylobacterium sp. J426 TaxID=2898439 RepID=UPI002151A79C|nr:response regulator [Phenylobacterium sp. J426]MCR5875045.1 response regulator [Phenylobacterium sp. J426]
MSVLSPMPVVLAVDDEALVLEVIQAALEDGGYGVRTAASASEAIAILEMDRARDLHGLVTDVRLKGGRSGWEVASRARQLNPSLPIVYVTGDSSHEWASKGVPLSVIVTKPFAPAQIVVALASLANQADI